MRLIIVGGDWDLEGGRPSHLVSTLDIPGVEVWNGGYLQELATIPDCDALVWMPNIDNEHDKILPRIKRENPAMLLVQSKCKRDYSDFEVIKRLLASHSCLGLVVHSTKSFGVIDPLGNEWCKPTDFKTAMLVVVSKLKQLSKMTRKRTIRWGGHAPMEIEPAFLEAVTALGKEFASHTVAANPDRLLGNASTRCSHGFPSARTETHIAMSRRNVEKVGIGSKDFVPTKLVDGECCYRGVHKPSVDTPIQLALYDAYPNVKYMVHGHCYVAGAPYTEVNVPCGYLEEVQEIIAVQPNLGAANFVVNLKGHGCLIFAATIDNLLGHPFVGRPLLESVG